MGKFVVDKMREKIIKLKQKKAIKLKGQGIENDK